MGISIIIPNYSDYKNLIKCVSKINNQDFNKEKLEVIIAEGDKNFKKIKKKFKFKIKQRYFGFPQNQEARKYCAIKICKFKILCFLDTDNFLDNNDFLKIHYKAMGEKYVSFSYCKYYSYLNAKGWINKYYSVIGGNDPISYFFNKNDRLPYSESFTTNENYKIKVKKNNYSVYKFNKLDKTIGANGFFVRKEIYKKLKNFNPESFLHIDTNISLLNKEKYKFFALVNSELTHETSGGLYKNLIKRINYFNEFYFNMYKKRKFKIVDLSNFSDVVKLVFLILSSATILYPIFFSIFKLIKTKKLGWIYHGFLINLFILTYAYISLKLNIKKICNV